MAVAAGDVDHRPSGCETGVIIRAVTGLGYGTPRGTRKNALKEGTMEVRPGRTAVLAVIAIAALSVGCAQSGGPATPTSAGATVGTSVSAPPQTQAASMAPTTGPTLAANCLNREAWDILSTVRDYSTLTPAQIALLITSLRDYDYGTNQLGADWRDRYTAALEQGDLDAARREAAALVGGVVQPKVCPA